MERFEIRVPDSVLDDLKDRLARTRFPDQLDGAEWNYGTELSYLRELVAYWRDKYDWRTHERALNHFDHYKTRVRDLDIHYIHQRSKEPNAFPLVITHGWPGSVFEFHKILGPLTDPVAHGGKQRGRLPRRVPVDARLRLEPGADEARLRHQPGRRDQRRADGQARLRALRRAGR